MKPTTLLAAAIAITLASGCARSVTRQGDMSETTTVYSLDSKGRTNSISVTEKRQTTTRASATAAVSGSNALKGLSATQDGKKQGLTLKESGQQSDIDKVIDVVGRLAPILGSLSGVPMGSAFASSPGAVPAAPAGKKWVLKPVDDPSTPQLETPTPSQ